MLDNAMDGGGPVNGVGELDLSGVLPPLPLFVEASAGTGKTYSLSALVARHIAERGVLPSELLVVTFTRAAAAELRSRTRRVLVQARDACISGVVPPDQSWMTALLVPDDGLDERTERLTSAVSSFDEATISTIHGFCQQALTQIGVRGGRASLELSDRSIDDVIDEVCTDLVVGRLSRGVTDLSWMTDGSNPHPATPNQVLATLKHTVTEIVRHPTATVLPPRQIPITALEQVEQWRSIVLVATELVAERREKHLEFGYDDLVNGLRHIVLSDDEARTSLAERFRLVMIDESQDNDPQQWDIFAKAFAKTMVTVGDPKQAIYRFRGADVYAYLDKVDGQKAKRLSTNHRSDAPLVAANNALLTGFRLGDERIEVAAVAPADECRPPALGGVPMQIRWIPTCDDLRGNGGKGPIPREKATALILADLTHVVADLLTETINTSDGSRPVDAGDIAVLVGSGAEADQVRDTLTAAGVPAVRTATNSVLEVSAAVEEWRTFLYALDRPTDAGRLRAGGLGAFIQMPLEEIDAARAEPSGVLVEAQARCVEWAAQLGRRSFLGWYDRVRQESTLVARLLTREGGERLLTDLDHIAELLAAELGQVKPTPGLALRHLDRLVRSARGSDDSGPQVRRIDSDARAVQISTIHKSKGLEYPIVLLPFLWTSRAKPSVSIFNGDDGTRVIDAATPFAWTSSEAESETNPYPEPDRRRGLAERAQRGDQLRVMYVAFTRARHRTIAWWAPAQSSSTAPLSAVLFDRDDDLRPLNTYLDPSVGVCAPVDLVVDAHSDTAELEDRIASRLRAIENRHPGLIEVHPLDPDVRPVVVGEAIDPGKPPHRHVLPAPAIDSGSWRRWSFTGITRHAKAAHGEGSDETDNGTNPPNSGGTDEGPVDHDEPLTVDEAASRPEMPWADLPGGTAFGTLVHDILERVDPVSPTFDADLERLVTDGVRRSGLRLDPVLVTDGLRRSMTTPLGKLFGNRRLVDFPVGDRLAELRFDLPLVGTDSAVALTKIGEVLLGTLLKNDEMRPYATSLAEGRFGQSLAGFLQGSIDGVFRVRDPGKERFVVVDYKTNQLRRREDDDALAAYHPARLPAAMAHSDYPLQALLYSVALHRYLRWRLPGYRPEDHLGGIAYLYLRGMVGADTPRDEGRPFGVFEWEPPSVTIEALDHLFSTGKVRV
jgi:exodeoxyribonuclease V beta subunit